MHNTRTCPETYSKHTQVCVFPKKTLLPSLINAVYITLFLEIFNFLVCPRSPMYVL